MSNMKRGWLIVAAALAIGASGLSRAGDGGAGGDSGDNGMNPMYGDSYATLEGQGHNAGTSHMAPEGAYAAHEMDGRTTPIIDQMRQTQARMAEQARHNWDAMVERTRTMTDRVRTSMNMPATSASTTSSTGTSSTGTTSTGITGTTTIDSTPQPTTSSGARIAPANPRGQAPTVVAPTGAGG